MVNRARLLLVAVTVALAARAQPAAPASAELASVESLRAAGVICRRVTLQALTASVEIDVTVDASKAPGRYEGAECVVLKEPAPVEKLPAADAAALADDRMVARRARSAKTSPAFLVLGREFARAYLAFEFAVPGDDGRIVTRRLLLPVGAVGERRVPAPEPYDPASDGPLPR
ncbi:MAG TPA: hypothetical protein VMF63_01945 [Opitutaceae bacterium]|nr:hypothetical protein [Opitutaceae bacterium]